MRKVVAYVLCAVCLSCSAYAIVGNHRPQIGQVYCVNPGRKVPVFCDSKVKCEYEVGFRGMNCYTLDTLLLPGFFVKVIAPEGGTFKVQAKLTNRYIVSGYINSHFFEDGSMTCCNNVDFDTIDGRVNIPPVMEMISNVREILDADMPYCWGGATLEEIPLEPFYEFAHKYIDISKLKPMLLKIFKNVMLVVGLILPGCCIICQMVICPITLTK